MRPPDFLIGLAFRAANPKSVVGNAVTMTTTTRSMRVVEASAFSLDALGLAERAVPEVRRGEILVRVPAASLNYRDIAGRPGP